MKAECGWTLVKAGATFKDDDQKVMTGSWFLLREESLEAARQRLSQDVYALGHAWDMSKVPQFALTRDALG